MASHTISNQPWPSGTLVSVYSANALPVSGDGTPVGVAITSATVSGSSVTFSGLSENVRYLAYAAGVGKRFLIPQQDPMDARSLRSRVDELEGDTLPVLDGRVGVAELNQQVRSLWNFLAPIVAPTPAQTLAAIHAGLDWSADTGGALLIPDSDEPWEVSGTIVPPPNSRMVYPHVARLTERQSRSGHGTQFYQLPASGMAMGTAWIKLSAGANCPILATDYTNAAGKRGPDRGNGAYWQWFNCFGITFDHNGRNQAESTSNGVGDVLNASPTVSNATGAWSAGDVFLHANVPFGTYVKAVVGATLTLTANATGTVAGAALSKGVVAVDVRNAWGVNFAYCHLAAPRGRGWYFYRCNECNGEQVTAGGDVDEVANGTGDSTIGTSTITNASGTWAPGDLITALPGFAYGTYVRTVVGSTLTLAAGGSLAVATSSVVGMSLTKPTFQADHLLAMTGSTTDCKWSYSMHGARKSTGLLDSSRGCVWDGLLGYSISASGGAYNLWLRNSFGADCINNQVTGRLDQASGHNCRIDTLCKSNDINTTDFSPGMFGRAADSDNGWVNKFCDGTHNRMGGVGTKGWGAEPNMANLAAFGANSGHNVGSMAGGHDLAANTILWRYESGAPKTNRVVGQSQFEIPATAFDPLVGTPAMATFNTNTRVLAFDPAATESAETSFVVPDGITGLQLRLVLVNMNSGVTGDVSLELGLASMALGGGAVLGADQATWTATVTIPASNAHVVTSFAGLIRTEAPGSLLSLRVRRLGAAGADTLAADLGLVGLRVEPLLRSS